MSQLADRLKQRNFESAGQKAILNLLVTGNVLREKMNTLCTDKNISIQQYNILRILYGKYPEGYARCDISERMIERAPDTTRILDRLVNLGYVKREKCTDDMRQSIAKITNNGISILKKMNERIRSFQEDFEKEITTDSCNQVSGLCDRILNKM